MWEILQMFFFIDILSCLHLYESQFIKIKQITFLYIQYI